MYCPETDRRSTRVAVPPVVIGVGHSEMSRVGLVVSVAVAYERGLPVIVEICAFDNDSRVGELNVSI